MSKIKTIIKRIQRPELLLLDFNDVGLLKMSDKKYLKLRYKSKFGYSLDLENPKTFNEKIQWMKLYYRRPELPRFVDKAEAKEQVAGIIGKQYIIPTIGVYNDFDEIDFDKLPNQFVIKCTHDSASVVICKDKTKFDVGDARKKINKALEIKYYGKKDREWVYSQIKPRIIIEKFMKDRGNDDIIDYKFFCFNGEPKAILVCSNRFDKNGMRETWYDKNWELLSITEGGHAIDQSLKRPQRLEEMKRLASELSAGFPFLRADFYEIQNKVYFGEMTFYPKSGYEEFEPEEWNEKFGDFIELPEKYNNLK